MILFDYSLILKYIDRRVEELDRKQTGGQASAHEASVLEKLLSIDRHAAVVMVMDMLFAGVDTVGSTRNYISNPDFVVHHFCPHSFQKTSTAVIGCLYHLAKNPEKQEKLRNEIRTYLPTKTSQLAVDSLNSTPYLRACFKESMRLSPIFTGLIRTSGQDIVLQGFQVPKGVSNRTQARTNLLQPSH